MPIFIASIRRGALALYAPEAGRSAHPGLRTQTEPKSRPLRYSPRKRQPDPPRTRSPQGTAFISSMERFLSPICASEYETAELDVRHVDLRLATREYRPELWRKRPPRVFSMYSRPEDASRLRRILDERELTAESFRYEHRTRPSRRPKNPRLHRSGKPAFSTIVATHSGYFTARQFLAFTGAHWGKRTTTFWSKLETKRHAAWSAFPRSGVVLSPVRATALSAESKRKNLRNRREHEFRLHQAPHRHPRFRSPQPGVSVPRNRARKSTLSSVVL